MQGARAEGIVANPSSTPKCVRAAGKQLGQPRETALTAPAGSPPGSGGQAVFSTQSVYYSSDRQSLGDHKIGEFLVGCCSLQFRG